MAATLATAGRPAAGASLLDPLIEVAARSSCLGPRHAVVGRAWLLSGHCHRVAAAAAHAWLRRPSPPGAPGEAVVGAVRAHAAGHLNRAAHSYERALVLTQQLVAGSPAPPRAPGSPQHAGGAAPASSALLAVLAALPQEPLEGAAAAAVSAAAAATPAAHALLSDASFGLADALGMVGASGPAMRAALQVRGACLPPRPRATPEPPCPRCLQAYELRRAFQQGQRGGAAAAGAGVDALLHSLQQLAGLADRSARPADALRYLEPLIAALKECGAGGGVQQQQRAVASVAAGGAGAAAAAPGAAAAAVQHATRHAVRLAFRTFPVAQRSTLQQAVAVAHPSSVGGGSGAAGAGGCEHSPAAVSFVVGRLFDHPGGPSAYVRLVAGQILSAAAAGASLFTFAAMSAVPGQPSLLEQLAVLASFLAEPAAGAGVDLLADAGCSAASTLGARSSVGAALRPQAGGAPGGAQGVGAPADALLRLSAAAASEAGAAAAAAAAVAAAEAGGGGGGSVEAGIDAPAAALSLPGTAGLAL